MAMTASLHRRTTEVQPHPHLPHITARGSTMNDQLTTDAKRREFFEWLINRTWPCATEAMEQFEFFR